MVLLVQTGSSQPHVCPPCGHEMLFLLPRCLKISPQMFLSRWDRPFPSWMAWMVFNTVPSKGKGLKALQPAGDDFWLGKYMDENRQLQQSLMGKRNVPGDEGDF